MESKKVARKHIVSVRLYHFQAHIDTTIKFNGKSNAIIGDSDTGKTAVSRAIYWALYNKPTRVKDEFVTHGAKHCFVTVQFSDGVEITRGRNGDENYYILQKGDDRKEFKGFGFEVPPEVMDAHGMYMIDFDDSGVDASLNISQQLDPIFMFEDSATRRAKVLGKISGADRADGALGIASGWLKEKRSTRAERNKQRLRLDDKIKQYDFLTKMGATIEELTHLVNEGKVTTDLRDTVVGEMAKINMLMVEKAEVETVVSLEHKLISVDEYVNAMRDLCDIRSVIETTLIAYSNSMHDKQQSIRIINNADKIIGLDTLLVSLDDAITMRDIISESYTTYVSLRDRLEEVKRYTQCATHVEDVENVLNSLDLDIRTLMSMQDEYTTYMTLVAYHTNGVETIDKLSLELEITNSKIKEAIVANGGVCPTCGTTVAMEV